MIPLKLFPKIEPCEHDEYAQCDDFLDDFQLEYGEFAVPDAIRRDLEAVLKERNHPAEDNDGNQGVLRYFKWPYQAVVMKMLEQMRRRMVFIILNRITLEKRSLSGEQWTKTGLVNR